MNRTLAKDEVSSIYENLNQDAIVGEIGTLQISSLEGINIDDDSGINSVGILPEQEYALQGTPEASQKKSHRWTILKIELISWITLYWGEQRTSVLNLSVSLCLGNHF